MNVFFSVYGLQLIVTIYHPLPHQWHITPISASGAIHTFPLPSDYKTMQSRDKECQFCLLEVEVGNLKGYRHKIMLRLTTGLLVLTSLLDYDLVDSLRNGVHWSVDQDRYINIMYTAYFCAALKL